MNVILIRSETIRVHNVCKLTDIAKFKRSTSYYNYVGTLHAVAAILMSFGSNHNAGDAPAVTEENLSIKW